MKVFEDMTMFEQRIVCRRLPVAFHRKTADLEQRARSNRHKKMVQELKRVMLNVELEDYEIAIQDYEQSYQDELLKLEQQIRNPSTDEHKRHTDILLYFLHSYLQQLTDRLLRRVRFKESCLRVSLRRHHRRQQQSSSGEQRIDVYPQTIVDVSKVALNQVQFDYLSQNGKQAFLQSIVFLHRVTR